MPTTLADIASALGVSKMTVSRAINNHPEISSETRARILDTAQRMNYRPNQFARALTTNRSYLLGVIVPADGFWSFLGRRLPETALITIYRTAFFWDAPTRSDQSPQFRMYAVWSGK